jgi:hypothetical protein
MTATPRSHLSFPPDVLLKAQGAGAGIKAAIFDVDGVLTDGTIWITEAGETLKNFNVLDGQGLLMLRKGGIVPVVITGRDSPAVRRRVSDLGLAHAAFGRARGGARRRASRHRPLGRPGCRARVLRPAADGQRPVRAADDQAARDAGLEVGRR